MNQRFALRRSVVAAPGIPTARSDSPELFEVACSGLTLSLVGSFNDRLEFLIE